MSTTLEGFAAKTDKAKVGMAEMRRRASRQVGEQAVTVITQTYATIGYPRLQFRGRNGKPAKWRLGVVYRKSATVVRPVGAIGGAYLAEFGTRHKPNGYDIAPGRVTSQKRAAVRQLAAAVAGKKVRRSAVKGAKSLRTPEGQRAVVHRGPQRGKHPFAFGRRKVAKVAPDVFVGALNAEIRKAGIGR